MVEARTGTRARPVVLFGVGASPGVARGPARLVRTRAELGRLRADDVLVVDALPTSLVAAVPACRAVVTQIGGQLQFSARTLRRRGVPAVVGALGALAEISDGDLLEVDGYSGIVRVVA